LYASSKNCPGSNDFGDRKVDSSTGFDIGIESGTEAFTFGVRTDLDRGGLESVNNLDDRTGAAE